MRPIEKYVEAMENKDFAGLAELFTPDGILCDYCTTSASQQPTSEATTSWPSPRFVRPMKTV